MMRSVTEMMRSVTEMMRSVTEMMRSVTEMSCASMINTALQAKLVNIRCNGWPCCYSLDLNKRMFNIGFSERGNRALSGWIYHGN